MVGVVSPAVAQRGDGFRAVRVENLDRELRQYVHLDDIFLCVGFDHQLVFAERQLFRLRHSQALLSVPFGQRERSAVYIGNRNDCALYAEGGEIQRREFFRKIDGRKERIGQIDRRAHRVIHFRDRARQRGFHHEGEFRAVRNRIFYYDLACGRNRYAVHFLFEGKAQPRRGKFVLYPVRKGGRADEDFRVARKPAEHFLNVRNDGYGNGETVAVFPEIPAERGYVLHAFFECFDRKIARRVHAGYARTGLVGSLPDGAFRADRVHVLQIVYLAAAEMPHRAARVLHGRDIVFHVGDTVFHERLIAAEPARDERVPRPAGRARSDLAVHEHVFYRTL